MITKYLSDNDLNRLKNIFNPVLFENVDYKNLEMIISFLEEKEVNYIKDMLLNYFDLFLIEYNVFVNKFNMLCIDIGEDAIKKISDDMSLLDNIVE